MPSDVTKYFLYMQKQGLRVSTLKKYFSSFNSIFKYAIYIGITGKDFAYTNSDKNILSF